MTCGVMQMATGTSHSAPEEKFWLALFDNPLQRHLGVTTNTLTYNKSASNGEEWRAEYIIMGRSVREDGASDGASC